MKYSSRVKPISYVKQSGILCPIVLPGGASTLSIGNPLRITDYVFHVTRNPPSLGEHGADVFEDWLRSDPDAP